MITFILSAHTRRDQRVCEIWQGGDMIGVIYPTEDGVRIISKHFDLEPIVPIAQVTPLFPTALEVHIREAKHG
jgi:hypothetical protein